MTSTWGNATLLLRTLRPRLSRLFASWQLSVALMLSGALYYALIAIWSRASAPQMVRNIAGLAPFLTVYALLLANTAWCLWKRLPVLLRDVSPEPRLGNLPPDAEAAVRWSGDDARARLRAAGFAVQPSRDGGLFGVRRRFAAVGTYLFHAALLLLACGFLTTLWLRSDTTLMVAVGEEFTGDPSQILAAPKGGLTLSPGALPRFTVESVDPQFWGDRLLFTHLSATLVDARGARSQVRINQPLWLGFGTFLRLTSVGYAPRFELRNRQGALIDSTFLKLNVFPPGLRDSFRLGDFPHRVYLEVYPDAVHTDGALGTRSMNLANPRVRTHVVRGKVDLGAAELALGQPLDVEGLSLSFPEIRYWSQFELLSDPGAPIILLSLLMGLAGLLVKVRGPRAELEWTPSGALRGWRTPLPVDAEARR